MKRTYINTDWTPEDAYLVWRFVNELHDLIWKVYRQDIIQYLQGQADENEAFDDDIPF